ncbi:MAG: hypothetical protein K0V04_00755 [Deltaproteobacteria bacterium]|nr:hypothetical protein [Deltaproteobacteria bacterium]
MAKTTAKLLGFALAGAGAYGLWTAGQTMLGDDEATGTEHVANQVWIEKMPQSQRDMFGHLVLLDMSEGRFGGVGKSSQWRHMHEFFQWGLSGDRLSVYFPQDRQKGKVKVRSWRCEGEAPEPFELCLELSNGRQSTTMYSRDEWHIDPDDASDSLASLIAQHPELRGVVSQVQVSAPIDEDERDDYTEVENIGARFGQ